LLGRTAVSDLKSKKVFLILGGLSKERDVSLMTGEAIYKALCERGYNVEKFDPKTDDWAKLKEEADLAFISLHGKFGEDGCVQGLLEMYGIPYTGSGILSSALCYDKDQTKIVMSQKGINIPKTWVYTEGDIINFIESEDIVFPVMVKPNREGSTIGMTVVEEKNQLEAAIKLALESSPKVLIEEFISGTEVTVGLLNGKAMTVVEIVPKSGLYDYKSKYEAGQTDYFFPARISDALTDEVRLISEKAYNALGCNGAPRADYIIDKQGKIFFLEMNTIPGMTETSLLPKSAAGSGINFADLCEKIVQAAKLDYAV